MNMVRDPFDDEQPIGSMRYRVRRRRMPRKDFWLTLGMLAFLGVVLGVAVVQYLDRNEEAGRDSWIGVSMSGPPSGVSRDGKFIMAGVAMADTPRQVREVHPDVTFAEDREGRRIGLFEEAGGRYRITFLDTAQGGNAFRMTYYQTFAGIGHDEIMERMAAKFGRPATGDCGRRITGRFTECRYSWWLRDSNRLKVTLRSRTDPDLTVHTEVAMLAVNTYLEGKARPIERPGTASPPTPPQRQELEKLPFD